MKTSMVILYVLVSLSLVLSLITVVTLWEDHIGFNFGTAPIPTPTPTSVLVSYNETSREVVGDNTKVTLAVNATYISGRDVTISYSQFYLRLYGQRSAAQIPAGEVYPLNNGTFMLGVSNQEQSFQLIFEFGSDTFNGMNTVATLYHLEYNGTISIQWLNGQY